MISLSTGHFGNGAQMALGASTVSELTNIGLPGLSADDIDITTHNDSDKIRQFIKGLVDPGEISFEGNMNYTDYAVLYAQMVTVSTGATITTTITLPTTPSSTKFECSSYLKSLEGEAPHDDKIAMSGTVKVSGKPILTQF